MDERTKFDFFLPKPFSFWFPSHDLIAFGAAYRVVKKTHGKETCEIEGEEIETYVYRETAIVALSRGMMAKKKKSKYGLCLPN